METDFANEAGSDQDSQNNTLFLVYINPFRTEYCMVETFAYAESLDRA